VETWEDGLQQIQTLINQGYSNTYIGQKKGISGTWVHRIIIDYGLKDIPYPIRKKIRTALSHEQRIETASTITWVERSLSRIRAMCRRNNTPFTLQIEDFLPVPIHCPILGIELNYSGSFDKARKDTASFDRVIPNLGYVKGNVNIVSWEANRLKNNACRDDLVRILHYMDTHTAAKNIPK
jgi:hypothetical protein